MKWSIVLLGTSLALAKGHHHHHHHRPPPPPPPPCVTETVTRHCEPCQTATRVVTVVVPDPTTETVVDYQTRTIVNEVTATVVNEVTATVVNEVTATECIEHVATQTVYVPTGGGGCKGGKCHASNPKPTPQPQPDHHHHHHGHHHHHHQCHHHNTEYIVRKGDCCWGIAKANGMSVQDLIEENPWLNAKCDLNPGEKICVKEPHRHHHHHHARDVNGSAEATEAQPEAVEEQEN